MILEILAVLSGIVGVVIAAVSLYAIGGWPAFGLLVAFLLCALAGVLGNRPDKPL